MAALVQTCERRYRKRESRESKEGLRGMQKKPMLLLNTLLFFLAVNRIHGQLASTRFGLRSRVAQALQLWRDRLLFFDEVLYERCRSAAYPFHAGLLHMLSHMFCHVDAVYRTLRGKFRQCKQRCRFIFLPRGQPDHGDLSCNAGALR